MHTDTDQGVTLPAQLVNEVICTFSGYADTLIPFGMDLGSARLTFNTGRADVPASVNTTSDEQVLLHELRQFKVKMQHRQEGLVFTQVELFGEWRDLYA